MIQIPPPKPPPQPPPKPNPRPMSIPPYHKLNQHLNTTIWGKPSIGYSLAKQSFDDSLKVEEHQVLCSHRLSTLCYYEKLLSSLKQNSKRIIIIIHQDWPPPKPPLAITYSLLKYIFIRAIIWIFLLSLIQLSPALLLQYMVLVMKVLLNFFFLYQKLF